MIHYVYITINLINGKQYIGDHTINPHERNYYIGSGRPYFKNAVKKYGKENFFKEILEWFSAHFKYWEGKNLSLETKLKIGLKHKGKIVSEETKEKIRISCKKISHVGN